MQKARELQSTKTMSRYEFQLAAMTALYLAVKVHEPHYKQGPFNLRSVAELSQGFFQPADICRMESRMLEALKWRMNPPTPLTFLQHLYCLLDESIPHDITNFLVELSCFLTELAVCDADSFIVHRPSVIALAALYNAIEMIDLEFLSLRNRLHFIDRILDMTSINPESDDIYRVQDALSRLFAKTKSANRYDQYRAFDGAMQREISMKVLLDNKQQLIISMLSDDLEVSESTAGTRERTETEESDVSVTMEKHIKRRKSEGDYLPAHASLKGPKDGPKYQTSQPKRFHSLSVISDRWEKPR